LRIAKCAAFRASPSPRRSFPWQQLSAIEASPYKAVVKDQPSSSADYEHHPFEQEKRRWIKFNPSRKI
jgi:hypothetical protein